MTDPNLSVPDGCDRCPNSKKPATNWTPRYVWCSFIAIVLISMCYHITLERPDAHPGSGEVKVGGLYIQTREPNYLVFGIGMLAIGAALEVPMGAITKILLPHSNRGNNE